jgi:uncharacterized damage-inducible protein DinB
MDAAEAMWTHVLQEGFLHHAWATKQLLLFCQEQLSFEEQTASTIGSYGGIVETFNHIIIADGGYLRAPTGQLPDWAAREEQTNDLNELLNRLEESSRLWEGYLSHPHDSNRVVLVDDGAHEVREGIILIQALYHGHAHREQICTILTSLSLEPPDIQPWEYAWDWGRIWRSGKE